MYDWTNKQAQWTLRRDVRRDPCGKEAEVLNYFVCTIFYDYALFDGVYPVGSTWAEGTGGGHGGEGVLFSFFTFSSSRAIQNNQKIELIFDEVLFAELKDENYPLRQKWMFDKSANEFPSFPPSVVGGLVDSTSGDKRAFMKEPEFYPLKCAWHYLKASFSRM